MPSIFDVRLCFDMVFIDGHTKTIAHNKFCIETAAESLASVSKDVPGDTAFFSSNFFFTNARLRLLFLEFRGNRRLARGNIEKQKGKKTDNRREQFYKENNSSLQRESAWSLQSASTQEKPQSLHRER